MLVYMAVCRLFPCARTVTGGPSPYHAMARPGMPQHYAWGHLQSLYEAPTDNTKPQKDYTKPLKRLYKDFKIVDKAPKILYKDL